MLPPVVLIIFNRPDTTTQVFAMIRQARPSRLFVIADAARRGKAGEAELCLQARVVTEAIDWPCEVVRDYAGENMGCQRRVCSGLNAVFARVDRAIILEDDCLPDPSFFPYCKELLERYADDPQVTTISGNNFAGSLGGVRGQESYHFTRYPHIWGWATWARAWKGFNPSLPWWRGRGELLTLRRQLGTLSAAMFWFNWARQVRKGKLSSWGIPWVLTQWHRGTLAICPEQNLVTNIGFGVAATHTVDAGQRLANVPTAAMVFPMLHPATMEPLAEAQVWTERFIYSGGRGPSFGNWRRWALGK